MPEKEKYVYDEILKGNDQFYQESNNILKDRSELQYITFIIVWMYPQWIFI